MIDSFILRRDGTVPPSYGNASVQMLDPVDRHGPGPISPGDRVRHLNYRYRPLGIGTVIAMTEHPILKPLYNITVLWA